MKTNGSGLTVIKIRKKSSTEAILLLVISEEDTIIFVLT